MENENAPFIPKSPRTSVIPIDGFGDFWREFKVESKKLWLLAGPAMFTSICQYSLGAITQVFAGHVGTLDLAAFTIENSDIAGLSFGIMILPYRILILFAGYLKNAEISLDSLSICVNILGWTIMVSLGFNVAASVRVSNELGASHPRTAKFSVVVVVINSFSMGLVLSLILIITRKQYPSIFTTSEDVSKLVYALTPLLATSIVVNMVQPVLSGVAIGAGWQALVAYVNIGCYYVLGIPLGLILGYKLDLGVEGIWYGMLSGTLVQTLILIWLTYRTDWEKEAAMAEERVRQWGGTE